MSTPMLMRHSPKTKPPRRAVAFPPRLSSGYLVRDAHRAFQRLLERRIAVYGVTRGQWYFLRVLWTADGLSQNRSAASQRKACRFGAAAQCQWKHRLGRLIVAAP
jgi:hypothetical protein